MIERLLGWALVFLAFASCAKIVPPDGGAIDNTPPRDTLMVPPNQSTYFNSKTIYIEFTEFVRLNDIYNELVVSPPLKNQPEIRIKRKGVTIALMDTLLRDVTYTMNFGEGIVDITESNPTENLLYVFSTGAELDSLELSGKVLDAYTGAPVENVKVMLYQGESDTLPRTEKPYYFTTTDGNGKYRFRYLKEGNYALFALKEDNRNYLFDDRAEKVAFLEERVSPVLPSDTSKLPTLYLSSERDTVQYMTSYDIDSTGFVKTTWFNPLRASTPVEVSELTGMKYMTWVEGKDSLFFWSAPVVGSEQRWGLRSGTTVDTLTGEVLNFSQRTLSERGKKAASVKSEDTLCWRFDRTIYALDSTRMAFFEDSIPIRFEAFPVEDPFAVCFSAAMKDDKKYRVELYPKAIRSREGWYNDSLYWDLSTYSKENYGKLSMNLVAPGRESYVFELFKENGDVVEQRAFSNDTTFQFTRMLPGTYKARVIKDINEDGVWTPAEYVLKRQPERVFNLQEAITIRSNWEVELDWELESFR